MPAKMLWLEQKWYLGALFPYMGSKIGDRKFIQGVKQNDCNLQCHGIYRDFDCILCLVTFYFAKDIAFLVKRLLQVEGVYTSWLDDF